MPTLTFSLDATPPFRLDLTVWALRRRPHNAIDRWDGRTYRRVLVVDGYAVAVAATQADAPHGTTLQVSVEGDALPAQTGPAVARALRRMLGLDSDLTAFYRMAAGDAQLGPLVEKFRGVKPPRMPTVFEALANAIACQQVTLTLGILLLNRLAEAYGAPGPAGGAAFAFPAPENLADVSEDALRGLGLSRQKARALGEAARAVVSGDRDLEGLAALDDAEAVSRLRELHGVGRWTAEYALLRGLGRLHIFPGDDVGARNHLARWLELPEPLTYERTREAVGRWQPYAGLVYFHLLLRRLASDGHLA